MKDRTTDPKKKKPHQQEFFFFKHQKKIPVVTPPRFDGDILLRLKQMNKRYEFFLRKNTLETKFWKEFSGKDPRKISTKVKKKIYIYIYIYKLIYRYIYK